MIDKDAVWRKAKRFNDEYCLDECGALIKYSDYGKRDSIFGWEVDHITSQKNGGTDAISNLRALHWGNNVAKSDGRLNIQSPAIKAFIKDKEKKAWSNAEKQENNSYNWM